LIARLRIVVAVDATNRMDEMDGATYRIGIVAIVDDDDDLREALASLLRASRFKIDAYSTAEDFLNSPRRREVSRLILDVRLPGMSGIELQKKLLDEGSTCPIVFISAHGDNRVRNLVMNAGAVGFLSKPVRSQALLKEIDSALKKFEAKVRTS
jgi:FixJ family two-component response regulator